MTKKNTTNNEVTSRKDPSKNSKAADSLLERLENLEITDLKVKDKGTDNLETTFKKLNIKDEFVERGPVRRTRAVKLKESLITSYTHQCRSIIIQNDFETHETVEFPKTDEEFLIAVYTKEFFQFIESEMEKSNHKKATRRESNDSAYFSSSPVSEVAPSPQTKVASTKFRDGLDPNMKQDKWVEVVQKNDRDLFRIDKNGESVLHRILRSKDKNVNELFYAHMEKMQKWPDKFEKILNTAPPLVDVIRDNRHTEELLNYFLEIKNLIRSQN